MLKDSVSNSWVIIRKAFDFTRYAIFFSFQAYKNFGSRISSLRKKLREKKKTLPEISPGSNNDMDLDNEEEEEQPEGLPGTTSTTTVHSSNIIRECSIQCI